MRIAVIIVNYRTPQLVLQCLGALAVERSALPDLRAIVVDNGSGDDSAGFLSVELDKVPFADWVSFMPLSLNGGFGWGNNQAMLRLFQEVDPPEAIYLLNPDTRIEAGALVALVRDMERRSDAGAIGSQLLQEDGSLAGSAFRFPSVAREFARGLAIGAVDRMLRIKPTLIPYGEREPVDWVTGASVLLRSEALGIAGLFDTGFFLYFEEVELMHRLRRHGWKSYHCPESRVVHIAGASTGVVDGRREGSRAPPDYIFQSRRRYFALTSGRLPALLASFAWLLGQGLSSLVQPIFPARVGPTDPVERRTLFKIGLSATTHDTRPALTCPTDVPGAPPAWTNK
jgi:N-acetylglucosaminyl-diphospho-decaprenol L-rhamnosyltransferase